MLTRIDPGLTERAALAAPPHAVVIGAGLGEWIVECQETLSPWDDDPSEARKAIARIQISTNCSCAGSSSGCSPRYAACMV
jgi:hypothetical protein